VGKVVIPLRDVPLLIGMYWVGSLFIRPIRSLISNKDLYLILTSSFIRFLAWVG